MLFAVPTPEKRTWLKNRLIQIQRREYFTRLRRINGQDMPHPNYVPQTVMGILTKGHNKGKEGEIPNPLLYGIRGAQLLKDWKLKPPFCQKCGMLGVDRDRLTGDNYIFSLVRDIMFQDRYDMKKAMMVNPSYAIAESWRRDKATGKPGDDGGKRIDWKFMHYLSKSKGGWAECDERTRRTASSVARV